ncbi:MAG TPA: S-layer homology domain-containing protein [Acidimicrobiia bacterium]|nr:S-layer homology domain-containing protein [Acidimicrobiia bacterium]
MRALAVVAIVVATVVTALAVPPAAGQSDLPNTGGAFEDDNGDYHEAAINAIAAAGITEGCAEDLYCPALSVTRAQMASFLARAYGLGTRAGRVFDDVTPGSTHAGAVAAIAAEGITEGCTRTLYCPEEPVTRAQMASFLARAEGLAGRPGRVFNDVTPGSTHAAAIAAIAADGITQGCTATRYCPADPVTRAQMASFLARALDLKLIYPTISLSGRFRGGCNSDRTRCTGTEHFPAGRTYEVIEGLVHKRPYLTGERSVFMADATRFVLTVDGETLDPDGPALRSVGGATKKVFVYQFRSMQPGTYTFVGRWRWNGVTVQTTVLTVVVD